jgi:hypothetical protein
MVMAANAIADSNVVDLAARRVRRNMRRFRSIGRKSQKAEAAGPPQPCVVLQFKRHPAPISQQLHGIR